MFVIDNGDAIRGIAEVATQLDFIVNGYVGTTATQLADGRLGTAEADLYLSGADATVVTSITIVNTDTAARTFTLYLKPSAGTSRAISPVSLDLGIGFSFYTDGQRIVVMDLNGRVVTTQALSDASPNTIEPDDAASSGTGTLASREDHEHAIVGAAPSELASVQAAGEGSSTSFARADHGHQIQHSIADNHLVTVDHVTPADDDYAKFTASGLEGRSYAEVKADLDLEIGTDVLAQQTIGIADNNLLEVDHVSPADDDYAKFTLNGLEGRSYSEVKTDLSLNNVENTVHSTDAHTMTIDGRDVSADGSKLDGVETSADVTDATNVAAAGAVMDADFAAADEVMVGTGAGTHGQVTLAASQFLAKKAAGAATNVTAAEARTILNVADGADVVGPASSTDNEIARQHSTTGKVLQTYTSNPPTISDTGDVNIDGDLDVENIVVSGNVDGKDVSGLATAAESVAAVEAAGLTFAENKGIILDAVLSADGKYSGITEAGTAGAALAFGDIVYLAVADSRWELAKADAAATSKGKIGMVVLAANGDGDATTILLYGKIRAATLPALTVGAPVHISAATAGDVVVAAPTGTTNFVVRIIGYGNTAEDLFFCPDNTYVELA